MSVAKTNWLSAVMVIGGLTFATMSVYLLTTLHRHREAIESVRSVNLSIVRQNDQLRSYIADREAWVQTEFQLYHDEHNEILRAIEELK